MRCRVCHGRGSLPYGVGQQLTAEGDETIRCCNVALDRRFGDQKRTAARSHCAAVINARRVAKAVRT